MTSTAIIIFDGECNLCSNSVNFIIARDKEKYFKFLSLQHPKAEELLKGKIDFRPDSVILIEDNNAYIRSRAALKISAQLTWPWKIVSCLRILPSFLLDPLYKIIAKNRYKLWGKRDQCMIPSAEIEDRFI